MTGLIEHLESRLGRITGGWSRDPGGGWWPFRVAHLSDGVLAGVESFATVGLSDRELIARTNGRPLRVEILLAGLAGSDTSAYPALVAGVAKAMIASGEVLLRGDVVTTAGPLVQGSRMEALYAANPVYYDDGFFGVDLPLGNRAAIVWLVPVSAAEAAYVRSRGWQAFERELTKHDPDLMDPCRPELSFA
ncbi:suppressor of fused domain protein [Amycolatopsis sp. NPDC001319]|uniref:suppressor of fused domain protein n=1 Tax=unclassified Amycolatopsis TaxID=2618356 RepID=UPI0036CC26B5